MLDGPETGGGPGMDDGATSLPPDPAITDGPRDATPREAQTAVSRPAEVMRVAMITREVLAEMRSADLSDAARNRARTVYEQSVDRLDGLLSDDLRQELSSLVGPRVTGHDLSTGELRVDEAQLAGWLDGLLQTLQVEMTAQAYEERAVEAEGRRRAEEAREEELQRRGNSYL